jgi:hypothetical protein
MEADWGVELGPEAPALEIPWQDPEGRWHYVALRGGAGVTECGVEARGVEAHDKEAHDKELRLERIPEARQFPALRQFLLDVNSPQSAWQTAKCGVCGEETEAAENEYGAGHMHSLYVDLVLAEVAASPRESAVRDAMETHEKMAAELASLLQAGEELEASGEVVVRRCYFHRRDEPEESDAGYCLTLFLNGYGSSKEAAQESCGRALALAAECLLRVWPGEKRA